MSDDVQYCVTVNAATPSEGSCDWRSQLLCKVASFPGLQSPNIEGLGTRLVEEVWPARFGTRNTEPGTGTRHIRKMTLASCRWSRACVRVGSWRRNAYSPPLGIFLQRRRDSTTTQQHDDSGVTEGEGLRGDTLRIGCSSGFWGDSATAGDKHDLFYILCLKSSLISRHWQEVVTFAWSAINLIYIFFHWNFEVLTQFWPFINPSLLSYPIYKCLPLQLHSWYAMAALISLWRTTFQK